MNIDWLAGFYEGEGSSIASAGSFRLVIAQKEKTPLEEILSVYSGSIYEQNGCHIRCLGGAKAADLASTLLPLMHCPRKVEQLTKALILAGYILPRNAEEKKEVESHRAEQQVRNKKYRNAHRGEIETYQKEYYDAHREEIKEYIKEYEDAHKEEKKEYHKEYKNNHKEETRAYMKEYYKQRKELEEKARQYAEEQGLI